MDKKEKGKMKELVEEEDVTLLLQPTTTAASSSSNSTAASSSRGAMMMPYAASSSSNSTAASSSRGAMMMPYAASSSSNSTAASSSRGVPPSMMMTTYAASGFYRPTSGGGIMRPIRMTNQQLRPLLRAPAAVARRGEPKTQLCRNYLPGFSHCQFGKHCDFAHGIHELKSISHEPTFKTKDCPIDLAVCQHGENCGFIHGYSLFGARLPIARALHHATAALMHDALEATRKEEEEEAAALLQDASAANQRDEEFAANSFSFTITKKDDPASPPEPKH